MTTYDAVVVRANSQILDVGDQRTPTPHSQRYALYALPPGS